MNVFSHILVAVAPLRMSQNEGTIEHSANPFPHSRTKHRRGQGMSLS